METATEIRELRDRVHRLERRLWIVACLALPGIGLLLGMRRALPATGVQEILRTRALVVIDSEGRDRIVLGAPVPDPRGGKRINPSTGMVINGPDGHERFGVGLKSDGAMTMGFDAPPGVGDPRNRERLNLAVFPDGRAELRVLDNGTRVRARFLTEADGLANFEFLQWSDKGYESSVKLGLAEAKRVADLK